MAEKRKLAFYIRLSDADEEVKEGTKDESNSITGQRKLLYAYIKKTEEFAGFPIGEPNDAFAKYFVGQSYLAPITTEQVGIFNVTFEPGCRNNWHIHHAKSGGGQILVCVAGRGFYQEEGRDAVEMNPGDCINIPVDVKHWHGAAPDEWFSHLAIEVPGVDCSNEWCEAVSEKEYAGLR